MKKKLPATAKEAFSRAAALCAAREYCAYDIAGKMKTWGLAEYDIMKVIERLKEDGFIDEWRFARAYVKDKARLNGWGRRRIALQLAARKISPEVCEVAFMELEDNAFSLRLGKLLRARAEKLANLDPNQRRRRLTAFALGRGYSLDEIEAVLDELASPDK